MNDIIKDRDALYYPYIHFRDENWLKASLLSFPQIRRMVPGDFSLNDSEVVKAFRDIEGREGMPLIFEENLDEGHAYPAQLRLFERIKQHLPELQARFSDMKTVEDYGEAGLALFQIHQAKILWQLCEFLQEHNMCWSARGTLGGYNPWVAMHPKLGEAIMSIIAIALADLKGLDIVTSSGEIHYSLATLDEDAVWANLLGLGLPPGAAKLDGTELADELTLMTMTTLFDYSKLSPQQIGELVREGHDLRQFKKELATIAESIPAIKDAKERKQRMQQGVNDVVSLWTKSKKRWPKYALEALIETADVKLPEKIVGVGVGAAALTGGPLALAAGAGLAVGFLAYSGYKIFSSYRRNMSSPYQYLSKIESKGASLCSRPVVG